MTRPAPSPRPGTSLDAQLGVLVERLRGPLVAYCRSKGAEDPIGMAQDAFAELWLGRTRFRGQWTEDGDVGPWLFGIASNLLASEARRRARQPKALGELDLPEPDQRPDQRSAQLRAAVEQLPEELRTPLVMCALEGSPVARVAALLGLPPKTVEGRLYRARKELARRLKAAAAPTDR